jgi:hypothetical protein
MSLAGGSELSLEYLEDFPGLLERIFDYCIA